MKKKFLLLTLAILMVTSLFTTNVFAIDLPAQVSEDTTIENILNESSTNEPINLIGGDGIDEITLLTLENQEILLENIDLSDKTSNSMMRAGTDYGNTNPNKALLFTTPASASVWNDYVRLSGESRWYAIDVPSNNTLLLKLNQPKLSSVDYDMYIYSLSGNSLYLLSGYGFGQFGPGANYTQEEYTVANSSSQTTRYYIEIKSFRGASNDSPFSMYMHVINKNVAQHDAFHAKDITFDQTIDSYINSPIDGDFYVMRTTGPNGIGFEINTSSTKPVYAITVYNLTLDSYGKYCLNPLSSAVNNMYYLNAGTYFIRVQTNNGVVDPSVKYTIKPIRENSVLAASYSPCTLKDSEGLLRKDNWGGFSKYVIKGALHAEGYIYDSNGDPLPAVLVTVAVETEAFGGTVKKTQAWTNEQGKYSIYVFPTAQGLNSFRASVYTHYFDNGIFGIFFGDQQKVHETCYVYSHYSS